MINGSKRNKCINNTRKRERHAITSQFTTTVTVTAYNQERNENRRKRKDGKKDRKHDVTAKNSSHYL